MTKKNNNVQHPQSESFKHPIQRDANAHDSDAMAVDVNCSQMAALKAIIFDSPETSQTTIAFIKAELTSERYEIHSARIAAKLLEFCPKLEEAEMA